MKKCYLLTNFKNFRPFCLHLPLFLRLFAIIAVDSNLALLVEILGRRVSQAPVRGYPL